MAMTDTIDSITKFGTLAAVAVGGYFLLKKFGVFDSKSENPVNFITPDGNLVAQADSAQNISDIQNFKQVPIYATKNGSNSSIYSVKPSANMLLNPTLYVAGAALTGQLKKTNVTTVQNKSLSPDVKLLTPDGLVPFNPKTANLAKISSLSFVSAYKGQSNSLSQSAKNTVLSKNLMKNNKSSVDLRSRLEKSKDILKK